MGQDWLGTNDAQRNSNYSLSRMTLHSPLRNREVLLSYTTLNMGERSCGTGCGELGHFANKSPASSLQGIVLFDEADLYLPALSKPPTKEPMEDLRKRARSAGL